MQDYAAKIEYSKGFAA